MGIGKEKWKEMLLASASLWLEKSAYLSDIDSRFGDGDHGVTMKKIAELTEKKAEAWTEESLYDFTDGLGMDIMAVNGGSAGPLYGTMISGLAEPLEGREEIDAGLLKEMFASSVAAMEDISKARVGDKTMMDALIPAKEAAERAEETLETVLQAAAEAAAKGAKDSENYISKFGRARSYKEQTIGTPDAGAVSTSLFFQGLMEGYRKK